MKRQLILLAATIALLSGCSKKSEKSENINDVKYNKPNKEVLYAVSPTVGIMGGLNYRYTGDADLTYLSQELQGPIKKLLEETEYEASICITEQVKQIIAEEAKVLCAKDKLSEAGYTVEGFNFEIYSKLLNEYGENMANLNQLSDMARVVSGKISKINNSGLTDNERAVRVAEARVAYDELPDASKQYVNNYYILTDAEMQVYLAEHPEVNASEYKRMLQEEQAKKDALDIEYNAPADPTIKITAVPEETTEEQESAEGTEESAETEQAPSEEELLAAEEAQRLLEEKINQKIAELALPEGEQVSEEQLAQITADAQAEIDAVAAAEQAAKEAEEAAARAVEEAAKQEEYKKAIGAIITAVSAGVREQDLVRYKNEILERDIDHIVTKFADDYYIYLKDARSYMDETDCKEIEVKIYDRILNVDVTSFYDDIEYTVGNPDFEYTITEWAVTTTGLIYAKLESAMETKYVYGSMMNQTSYYIKDVDDIFGGYVK